MRAVRTRHGGIVQRAAESTQDAGLGFRVSAASVDAAWTYARSFRQWRHVHALLHALEADQLEVVGRLSVSTASRILENTEASTIVHMFLLSTPLCNRALKKG